MSLTKVDLLPDKTSPKLPKEKQKLINMLHDYHHSILTPEGAQAYCDAFGVPVPKMREYQDSRSEFKGITLDGPNTQEGDKDRGYGGTELAEYICGCLNVKYQSYMGRGFQMQGCCTALSAYFAEQSKKNRKPSKKGKKK
jgi:hypothetical protein